LAVGDHDTILTSKDAASWKCQNSGTSGVLLAAAAYGENTFIVVGDSGAILSSTNGSEWHRHNSGTLAYLNRVVRSDGVFKTRASSFVLISTNTTNWSRHSFVGDLPLPVGSFIQEPTIVKAHRRLNDFGKGCKPNFVCASCEAERIICLSSQYPEPVPLARKRGASRSAVPYLALHPMGFSVPPRLRLERWLLPTFSPYQRLLRAVGGLSFCGTVRR